MLFIGFIACVAWQTADLAANQRLVSKSEMLAISNGQGYVLGATSMRDFAIHHPYTPITYQPAKPTPPIATSPMAAVVYHITTTEPVIFLTIDDGVTPDPLALHVLRKNRLPATLFLYDNAIWRHYDYFRYWQQSGATIQNHTVSHAHLTHLPYPQQKQEICDNANRMANTFGARPTLFRPPYGQFNDDTRRATTDCGMKALVWWTATVQDGALHYQGTDHLKPGDIVLLHFTPHLANDLQVLIDAAKSLNLQFGKLEDWLH
jgi:peptidoglycan/xylan/chitin deacetylase (PgdA/CDA1 family)